MFNNNIVCRLLFTMMCTSWSACLFAFNKVVFLRFLSYLCSPIHWSTQFWSFLRFSNYFKISFRYLRKFWIKLNIFFHWILYSQDFSSWTNYLRLHISSFWSKFLWYVVDIFPWNLVPFFLYYLWLFFRSFQTTFQTMLKNFFLL